VQQEQWAATSGYFVVNLNAVHRRFSVECRPCSLNPPNSMSTPTKSLGRSARYDDAGLALDHDVTAMRKPEVTGSEWPRRDHRCVRWLLADSLRGS
jgi:hypothetical protein